MPFSIRDFFSRLFVDPADPAARALYHAAVDQARRPDFYAALSVPDSLDGRFELVTLHVFMLLRRLKQKGPQAHQVGRRLMEIMVDDFDWSLREMGVGDTGISRRVKEMARGFAGRLTVYDAALDSGDDELLDVALDNNLYGTAPDVPAVARVAMAAYIRRETADPTADAFADLLAGRAVFGPPPAAPLQGATP